MPGVSEPTAPAVFVPGHLTGFFSVHHRETSLATGSRGAGVTLTRGVTVAVTDLEGGTLRLNGRRTTVPAVDAVLDELGTDATLVADADVPVGAGFGVSGALALGGAIAVNRAAACGRSENELVRIAHRAEVDAETGLGDVVAQHRGGVPIRLEPGGPDHGVLDGIPDRQPIEYLSFGELSTVEVLSGDTAPIDRAGAAALRTISSEPTLETFFRASHRFASEAGLLTDRVASVVDDVVAAGGHAAMGMLGRTVFALDDGLSAAGYDATRCHIAPGGVRIDPGNDTDTGRL